MSNSEESLIVSICVGEQRELGQARAWEIVSEILETIFESSSSSSEDSESENEHHEKCSNFEGTLDAMSEMDFKINMRLKRETVEYLTTKYSISAFLPDQSGGGRSRISPKKAVYMYIWYISNTVTFRQLGNLFGLGYKRKQL
ncbi:PREDICTED: uncharacterized protein LOC108372711 [Rhagoletis zephyria]|uniref:uncharacterized protein LOC108372711 n=1 Tax=Rhagoletis zephyria TaxID=28612 RepID=UPI000811320E|nr:PREDICTED: uncharacterized protein LOC108372711 [Rhagoletis zephyria]